MLLVALGIVAMGLAAGFALAGYKVRRIRRFIAETTGTHIVEALAELRPDSGTVEIAGRLKPGPSGLLTSPYGGIACVWHRHVVTRNEDGGPEIVDEGRSDTPFVVEDRTGRVVVDPRGGEPFGATRTVDRWGPDPQHRQQEWALLAGTAVSVRGEVTRRGGELAVLRPADGSAFVIAAESREGIAKLLDQAFRHRLPLCAAVAAAGAALVAIGLTLG